VPRSVKTKSRGWQSGIHAAAPTHLLVRDAGDIEALYRLERGGGNGVGVARHRVAYLIRVYVVARMSRAARVGQKGA
jgi:hypothetical protein